LRHDKRSERMEMEMVEKREREKAGEKMCKDINS
jgi:hypothetical protein